MRGRTLTRAQDRTRWFWILVAPFLAGLLLFVYVPVGWSAWLSLFDARNTVTPTRFVGLANYRYLLSDPSSSPAWRPSSSSPR